MPAKIALEPLIDAAAVARYLGVGRRTVYAMAQRRSLPAIRVGAVWRFERTELEAWLERQRRGSPHE